MTEKVPDSGDGRSKTRDSDPKSSKPKKEETPLWARRTVLDWYSGLGMKGRLLYVGAIFIAFNAVTWFFGFYFPKTLFLGAACLIVGLVISND